MKGSQGEFKEIRIEVPWGHIAAKAYGSPLDPPVLMVHGTLDNAGAFNRLLAHLPEKYHYVSIDLPGHGFSSHYPPGIALDFFNYVYVVGFVLAGLKWNSCIYIGHSLGATLGVFFSILYPGKIRKMVCLDSFLPIIIENKNFMSHIKKLHSLPNYSTDSEPTRTKEDILHALQFKRLSSLNLPAAEALFERSVIKVNDSYKLTRDPRLKLSVVPTLHIEQYKIAMTKFNTPALVILAEGSAYFEINSKTVTTLRELMKDSSKLSVIIVPGNHDVHNNNPELIAPHICKFLEANLQSKM